MKNKILITELSSVLAGSQKVTLNVIRNLKKMGFDIEVLLKEDDSLFDGFYSEFSCSTYRLKNELSEFFGTGNFSFRNMSFFTRVRFFFTVLFSNIQSIYIAKKKKCKTIYCYDPKGIFVSGLLAKFFNIKVIWHLHGRLNYPSLISKFMINAAHTIIVPSFAIRDQVLSLSGDRKQPKIDVIYNGFDFEINSDNSNENHKHSLPNIDKKSYINAIFVGTIVPNKGLHLILEKLIESKLTESVNFKVLGKTLGKFGDSYMRHLEGLVMQLPRNINVEFEGWVDNASEYIENSDVLIFASTDYCELNFNGQIYQFKASEALPTVLIESLSLNTPVIANNTSGVEEIVSCEFYGDVVYDWNRFDIDQSLQKLSHRKFIVDRDFINKFSKEEMDAKICELFKKVQAL
ncbi:glycosyltransferase [Vibrio campbellii]|uniref:glycosyltransferase n=1 Tax=Vibrio campbellii TaxID=680 RepID=UPI0009A53D7A|nr:glycosyltransferase [Vibrio campbellii]OPH51548.1 hypothetical protein B4U81_13930 [Vibrio campbellii]